MTKEDLIPYIEFDVENFWLESINPIHVDSLFIQHGIYDIESAYNNFRQTPSGLTIVNIFLNNSYILKGEYIISYMSNIVLTNRRIFIWFNDFKRTISLKNLNYYEPVKWGEGIKIEYLYNGAVQTIRLENKWLKHDLVNNTLNQHKNDEISSEEIVLTSNLKATLNALYSSLNEISTDDSIPEKVNPVIITTNKDQTAPKIIQNPNRPNNRRLITLFLVVLFLGGCVYFIRKKNENSSNIENITNSNVCERCNGTGVISIYGYCTDPIGHFHGDCSPETHTSVCTASGTKTCPCCHGTGKRQ